jgi:cytochrome d ubiquinol oxidase subunit I
MVDIIFTPSFPYRLTHTVIAFVVTTAFVILGVGAHYLRNSRFPAESRIMVRMSLAFLGIMVPAQIVVGDLHGLNTLQHQPAKVAAMEGLWETGRGVSASLFAIPDQEAETNHFEIAIPRLASLYLTHELDGEVRGLKEWPREDRPPVAVVYFAFRIMVGIGMLMLLTVYAGLFLWWKGSLFTTAVTCASASLFRRSASLRCWPAGPRPKWGGSPGSSTASCAPARASRLR